MFLSTRSKNSYLNKFILFDAHYQLISLFVFLGCFQFLQGMFPPPNSGFISIYNDEIVTTRNDDIQIGFQYGISSFDTTTSVFAGGFTQSFTSLAIVGTGTGATAFAQLQSAGFLRYWPGHETDLFFTAEFPNGSAASATQLIGLFDERDGAAVGYSGTDFGILLRTDTVDSFVPQVSFNLDRLDGSGPSGFTINTQRLNLFRIAYGWLGASPVTYSVMDQNGQWITFHKIIRSNLFAQPTFGNPMLPVTMQVIKTAGTDDLRIASGSWDGGVLSEPLSPAVRFFSVNSALISIPATETHLLTLRNKTVFQGRPNRIRIFITIVGIAPAITVQRVGIFSVRTNATVSGLVFNDVNTANSVAEFSTVGTYLAGTGISVLQVPVSTRGSGPQSILLEQSSIEIQLYPGQQVTVTGQSISTAFNTVAILNWREEF